MITKDEAMAYLGIDAEYADEAQTASIERALSAARMWFFGAVGRHPCGDPREDELLLMAVGDFFEQRTLTDSYTNQKVRPALTRLAADLVMQLKYEAACDGDV